MQPKPKNADNRSQRETVAYQILKAFNTGDISIIDELAHPDLTDDRPHAGLSSLKQPITLFREQFPDGHFEEEAIIVDGDMVVLRWKMTGTNTGPIYGREPTGKQITHSGNEFVRLRDGKIIEHFDSADTTAHVLEFLDKLGLLDEEMLQDIDAAATQKHPSGSLSRRAFLRGAAASLGGVGLIGLLEACTQVEAPTTPLPEDRATPTDILNKNKAVVRQITEAFNTGDIRLLEDLTDPELDDQSACPGLEPGLDGLRQQIPMIHEQFPDLRFEEVAMVAEGDMVVLRWKMTGTNTGPIYGRKPTGRQITHFGNEFVRLRDGKIIEHSDSADVLEFLDKLGLLDEEMLNFLQEIEYRPS